MLHKQYELMHIRIICSRIHERIHADASGKKKIPQ